MDTIYINRTKHFQVNSGAANPFVIYDLSGDLFIYATAAVCAMTHIQWEWTDFLVADNRPKTIHCFSMFARKRSENFVLVCGMIVSSIISDCNGSSPWIAVQTAGSQL